MRSSVAFKSAGHEGKVALACASGDASRQRSIGFAMACGLFARCVGASCIPECAGSTLGAARGVDGAGNASGACAGAGKASCGVGGGGAGGASGAGCGCSARGAVSITRAVTGEDAGVAWIDEEPVD